MTPILTVNHYPLFLEWLQDHYPDLYVKYGNDIFLLEESEAPPPCFNCTSVEARHTMEDMVREYNEQTRW